MWACTVSHVQLFGTPWTTACEAPLSVEFSRQEYWSGLPFPPPENLPDLEIEPASPALTSRFLIFFFFLTTEPPGKQQGPRHRELPPPPNNGSCLLVSGSDGSFCPRSSALKDQGPRFPIPLKSFSFPRSTEHFRKSQTITASFPGSLQDLKKKSWASCTETR